MDKMIQVDRMVKMPIVPKMANQDATKAERRSAFDST